MDGIAAYVRQRSSISTNPQGSTRNVKELASGPRPQGLNTARTTAEPRRHAVLRQPSFRSRPAMDSVSVVQEQNSTFSASAVTARPQRPILLVVAPTQRSGCRCSPPAQVLQGFQNTFARQLGALEPAWCVPGAAPAPRRAPSIRGINFRIMR